MSLALALLECCEKVRNSAAVAADLLQFCWETSLALALVESC